MNKVVGYVLVKETNRGVPNLVVAAYDCDEPEALRDQRRSPALLKQLGRRIGSVLTDAKGQFVLTSDDLSFSGNETRPDLLIAVFASEDIQKPGEFLPLPPEDRLLYLSAVARADAGAEEAYVIRLLQAQIERFEIPLSTSAEQGASDGSLFVSTVRNAWAFRDSVKSALKARTETESHAAAKRRKSAATFFQHLSGIPVHLRDDPKTKKKNPLRNNDHLISSKAALATELPTLQSRVIVDGLKRLAKATTTRKVRLHLSDTDLAQLGLKVQRGKLTGKTTGRALADMVRSHMAGADLHRVRGIVAPSPAELERRYLAPAQPAAVGKKEKTPRAKAPSKRKTVSQQARSK